MSSVSSDVKCPKCKYKRANYEINLGDGHEWLFCNRCGYWAEGLNGKKTETKNKGSWGVYFNGIGTIGIYKSNKQIKKFKVDFKAGIKNKTGALATFVYYTFLDKKTGKWFANILSLGKTVPFNQVEKIYNEVDKKEPVKKVDEVDRPRKETCGCCKFFDIDMGYCNLSSSLTPSVCDRAKKGDTE